MILEFASRWFVTGFLIKTRLYLGRREVHLSKSYFLSPPLSTAPNTGTLVSREEPESQQELRGS